VPLAWRKLSSVTAEPSYSIVLLFGTVDASCELGLRYVGSAGQLKGVGQQRECEPHWRLRPQWQRRGGNEDKKDWGWRE